MADPKIKNTFVDQAYSTMFVENLRPESFLLDGITYNSQYEKGDPKAGVVWFHKITKGKKGSEEVGGDYSHEETANVLVPIYVTNAFRSSKKLRGVIASQISAPFMDRVATEQAQDIRVAKDLTAIAGLVHGGTASLDTVETTKDNVVNKILTAKAELRKKNVNPTIILVSPEVEASLQEVHLTKAIFTPVLNDELVKAGVIGRYLGLYFFPRPELSDAGNTAVVYRDDAQESVDLSNTEFIMYDAKFFGKVDSFEEARIAPSNDFAGSYANIEQNAGFGVLDKEAVYIKNKA